MSSSLREIILITVPLFHLCDSLHNHLGHLPPATCTTDRYGRRDGNQMTGAEVERQSGADMDWQTDWTGLNQIVALIMTSLLLDLSDRETPTYLAGLNPVNQLRFIVTTPNPWLPLDVIQLRRRRTIKWTLRLLFNFASQFYLTLRSPTPLHVCR